MKQETDKNLPAFRVLAMLALAALAVMGAHHAARAQAPTPTPLWIPTGTNISPINTGNVGIGTTAPSFKLEVSGSTSRNTAGLTGDGDSVGFVGLRFGALTTTNISNNRTSAFILSMRKDTWYGGDGSGPSFIIETATKGGGFAAPFLITPTNDIILNSGRGAGGPAGYVPPYGNVGIGTHTPGYKLDVAGSVNASGGFCIAGVCKTSWPQVSGGWTASGSNVYFNTGSVGFGTTSPTFMLDSMGAIRGIGETNVNITNQYLFTGGGQQHYFDSSPPFAPLGRGATDAANGATTGPGANPGGIFVGGFGGTSAGAAGVYAQGGDTHTESYNRAWGGVGLFAQGGQNGPHTGGPYGWAYSRYAAAAFFNGYVQMGSNDGRASGLAIGFDGFNGYGAKLPPNGGMIVNGNVGVGTATPSYKLDVQGGQVNASGGLCIAGDCRVSWSQVAGGGGSTQWTTAGTSIYYNSGNVGVGTSGPVRPLHVDVGASPGNGFRIGRAAAANNPYFDFMLDTSGTPYGFLSVGDNLAYRNLAIAPFGGNVGVGTSTPRGRLEVAGGPLFLGDMGNASWGNMIVRGRVISSNNNIHLSPPGGTGVYINSDYREAGGPAGPVTLNVSGNITGAGFCIGTDCKTSWSQVGGASQWTTSGSNISYSGGNVGFGTAAPAERLQVSGGNVWGDAANSMLMLGPGREVSLQHDPRAGANNSGWLESNAYLDGAGNWQFRNTGVGGALAGIRPNTFDVWTAPAGSTPGWVQRFSVTDTTGYFSVNVGIGTASPAYKLDVAGQVRSSSGGFVFPDGTVQTTAAAAGGGTSQWANGANSSINYSSGAVGIGTGTTPPAEMLEVKGSGEVKARVTGTLSAGIQFRETTDASTWSEWQQFFDRFRLNTHDGTTTRPDVISVLPNGNVGIGKAVPTEALDVVGNIKATGSVSATYQDVAEWVPSTQKLAAGTVVVLDAEKTNHVSASASAYDTKVAGVVSEQPGIILGVGGEGKVKVATTGRVRVKVDASRRAIKVGDLLVTSEVEGVAMKSVPVDLGGTQIHRPGTIIGKALEPLESGVGEILVLLSLQ